MTIRGKSYTATLVVFLLLFLLVAFFYPASLAWPAEAIVTPESATVVPEGTEIVIPWGTYISELSSLASALIFGAIVWLMRKLPGQVVSFLRTVRAEQLIQRAIEYGINTTAGAVKDETLRISIGNEVIAKAVNYAVEKGSGGLVEWLGGPNGIGKMIIARLDVVPEATVADPVRKDQAPVLVPPSATVRSSSTLSTPVVGTDL